MKFKFAITLVMFTFYLPLAFSQTDMVPMVTAMSDEQVWQALVSIDAAGETTFGQCKVAVATQCSSCACPSYFRANIPGTLGYKGWPKNPHSGDSTGCLGRCGGGYTTSMCTADMKTNAKAMLLDALNKDACGASASASAKTTPVTIFDSSRFVFVDPVTPCNNNGKIHQCALVGMAADVGGVAQFSPIPKEICHAAYVIAHKTQKNQIKLITCDELKSKTLSHASIQQAASVVGQMNLSYSLFNLSGMQPLLDAVESKYKEMKPAEVALFYVAVNKDVSKLPEMLRSQVDPAKFGNNRGISDNYIVKDDIDEAEAKLKTITPNIILGNTLDVAQAMEQLQKAKTN